MTRRGAVFGFPPKLPSVVPARRPVLIGVSHKHAVRNHWHTARGARKRQSIGVGRRELRRHDGSRSRNADVLRIVRLRRNRSIPRRGEYGIGEARYVLITDSPSPSEHRLAVDLVSHAHPRTDRVGITRLVQVAIARAGVPNRPQAPPAFGFATVGSICPRSALYRITPSISYSAPALNLWAPLPQVALALAVGLWALRPAFLSRLEIDDAGGDR